MFQQLLAIIIILFFFSRLAWQKKKNQIGSSEFIFWTFFWLLATTAIIFIKKIDTLVASLGFSGTGIDVLFYIAVIILFYLIFRLRLKIEKQDKNITTIIRQMALSDQDKNN